MVDSLESCQGDARSPGNMSQGITFPDHIVVSRDILPFSGSTFAKFLHGDNYLGTESRGNLNVVATSGHIVSKELGIELF